MPQPSPRIVRLALCSLGLLALAGCGRDLEPLTPSATGAAGRSATRPPDALRIDAEQATGVEAPFRLEADSASGARKILALPQGTLTGARRGWAMFRLRPRESGAYHAWLRARWTDACGNSVRLRVGAHRERVIGQDAVYGIWHWVPAGTWSLAKDEQTAILTGNEDGVAVDQLLFTRDAAFVPRGRLGRSQASPGVRRFGDDFSRSPGHGLDGWETNGDWRIAFTFDPNRIPYQYSLTGRAAGRPALARLQGPPWRGLRLAFSLSPLEEGDCGAALDLPDDPATDSEGLRIGFRVNDGTASLHLTGAGPADARPLADAFRLRQWHRVVVERWAWMLRVRLDGRTVIERADAPPAGGGVGLFVANGAAAFDDVTVEEIPWIADDGRQFRIGWRAEPRSRWGRPRAPQTEAAIIGRRGAIRAALPGAALREVMLQETREAAGRCVSSGGETREYTLPDGTRLFHFGTEGRRSPREIVLRPVSDREVRIRRVALRGRVASPDVVRIGPYTFERSRIADPSDYLDFTPEEYAAIARSPEADKLLRQPKFMAVVGGSKSPWVRRGGAWVVRGGCLAGEGPGAEVRHWRDVISDLELRMKIRRPQPGSTAEVELYGGPEAGVRVRLGGTGAGPAGAVHLDLPEDRDWHTLALQCTGQRLRVKVDGGVWRTFPARRGDGGQVRLKVPAGRVEFDDILLIIPRRTAHGRLYAFDRREADWWRVGGEWVDHAGITCALASNWVALQAPEGQGWLLRKDTVASDLHVGFDVEENTHWYGWHSHPSHVHRPFHNICVVLAGAPDPAGGYRLEVNADRGARTVLYRNGKPVATRRQDDSFPMHYVGGHAPYRPRRNRIELVKRGGLLRALVNGREVLRYEDPTPLAVRHVLIGGYRTHINFSHIEIRELRPSGYSSSTPLKKRGDVRWRSGDSRSFWSAAAASIGPPPC